jgi:hypothetical protein
VTGREERTEADELAWSPHRGWFGLQRMSESRCNAFIKRLVSVGTTAHTCLSASAHLHFVGLLISTVNNLPWDMVCTCAVAAWLCCFSCIVIKLRRKKCNKEAGVNGKLRVWQNCIWFREYWITSIDSLKFLKDVVKNKPHKTDGLSNSWGSGAVKIVFILGWDAVRTAQ